MTGKESPAPLAGGEGANTKVERQSNNTKRGKSEGRSARLQRSTRPGPRREAIDFAAVNKAALSALPAVLARILPGGKIVGGEFLARNPRRVDRHLGSFKVNRRTGRWSDFATGDRGGDPISLVAFLEHVTQAQAAQLLARMLGTEVGGPRHG